MKFISHSNLSYCKMHVDNLIAYTYLCRYNNNNTTVKNKQKLKSVKHKKYFSTYLSFSVSGRQRQRRQISIEKISTIENFLSRPEKMFSKRPSRSLTLVCSVSLLCASSFAAFLVYSNLTFFESLLPLVWFLSVAVASGICSLVLGKKIPRE